MMSAEINPVEQFNGENNNWKSVFRRLELQSKVDQPPFHYVQGLLIGDDCQAVLAVCDDKTIKVIEKNRRNKYTHVASHFLPAIPICLCMNKEINKVYVGLSNGTITEFILSDDFKTIHHARDVLAHVDKINCIHLSVECQWLLSGSKDKSIHWYCTSTGSKVDSYSIDAWVTCIEFDASSHCAFVGDISGQVTVLKLNKNTPTTLLTCLKGHSASVRSLAWDAGKNMLFSGGGDNMVVVWDIGGKKGATFELSCHQDRVECLKYLPSRGQLISAGLDNLVVVWNMDAPRKQIEDWTESDKCEVCGEPFFWNIRMMWDVRSLGGRQHHCRKCGKSVCAKCSGNTSVLPEYGFETPVRLCSPCFDQLTVDELVPLSQMYHSKHKVTFMDISLEHRRLLTIGKDNVIKIWDMIEPKIERF